jgi:hypothetical protein
LNVVKREFANETRNRTKVRRESLSSASSNVLPTKLALCPQAENDPSPSADFSHCGLEDLPGALLAAVCLRKEALLLHDNYFTTLSANVHSLARLRVLDLHNNYISSLPSSFARLSELRVSLGYRSGALQMNGMASAFDLCGNAACLSLGLSPTFSHLSLSLRLSPLLHAAQDIHR